MSSLKAFDYGFLIVLVNRFFSVTVLVPDDNYSFFDEIWVDEDVFFFFFPFFFYSFLDVFHYHIIREKITIYVQSFPSNGTSLSKILSNRFFPFTFYTCVMGECVTAVIFTYLRPRKQIVSKHIYCDSRVHPNGGNENRNGKVRIPFWVCRNVKRDQIYFITEKWWNLFARLSSAHNCELWNL